MAYHVRSARPVSSVEEAAQLYISGLGLSRLGSFIDHDGFDGVMVGEPNGHFHFEFTLCRTHPIQPSPTPEDLIVFYVPDRDKWTERTQRMIEAGFRLVPSFNPYWDRSGQTFEDRDGYRVVIQNSSWNSIAK